MRHVIQINDKRTEDALARFLKEHEKTAKVVDNYDPIVRLSDEVEKMGGALRQFKQNGATWDVFYYYLRGLNIPASHIDSVMDGTKKFFATVGIKI